MFGRLYVTIIQGFQNSSDLVPCITLTNNITKCVWYWTHCCFPASQAKDFSCTTSLISSSFFAKSHWTKVHCAIAVIVKKRHFDLKMYVCCSALKKSEYVRLWWKIVVKQQLSQEKGTKNSVQKCFFDTFHRQFWSFNIQYVASSISTFFKRLKVSSFTITHYFTTILIGQRFMCK